MAVLHRRIRDLVIARDLSGSGASPPQLMKALNSKSEWAINKLINFGYVIGLHPAMTVSGVFEVTLRMAPSLVFSTVISTSLPRSL